MKKQALIVLGSVLLSIVVSVLLGRLVLRVTPFGHAVAEMRLDSTAAAQETAERKYGDLLEGTVRTLRLTVFVLDPLAAIISGVFVGFWGGKRSPLLAAFGILPLAAFSVFTYPWLWWGVFAGAMDIFAAAVSSRIVSAYRGRGADPVLSAAR
jgi:hypothetical protein